MLALRLLLKRAFQTLALAVVLPFAALTAFGRFRGGFSTVAHLFALLPGSPGSFLRAAYYRLTLLECSSDVAIAFGSFFAHPEARIGEHVSIGSYCVIGRTSIGAFTQIASHVEIPSGRRQHDRDEEGRLTGGPGQTVIIGSQCWIGASAVILADIGEGCEIGAGSVVVKPLAAHCVAAGNPARVIREISPHSQAAAR